MPRRMDAQRNIPILGSLVTKGERLAVLDLFTV